MAFYTNRILLVLHLMLSICTCFTTAGVADNSWATKQAEGSAQNAACTSNLGNISAFASSYPGITLNFTSSGLWTSNASFLGQSQSISRRVAPPYQQRGAQTFVVPPLQLGLPLDLQIDYQEVFSEMIAEMWMLAIAGLQGMGTQKNPSPSFLRYFDSTQFCGVQKAFESLLGVPSIPIDGPAEMSHVTIYWDDDEFYIRNPGAPRIESCATEFVAGYSFVSEDINNIHHDIVICPFVLGTVSRLDTFICSSLVGRYLHGSKHVVRGHTMLHELMHWNFIGARVGMPIPDFPPPPNRGYPIPLGQLPINGYGPYNSMLVQLYHNTGWLNADSYVWYALEAFLLIGNPAYPDLGCGGDKMDPPLLGFNDPLPDLNDPTNGIASDFMIFP